MGGFLLLLLFVNKINLLLVLPTPHQIPQLISELYIHEVGSKTVFFKHKSLVGAVIIMSQTAKLACCFFPSHLLYPLLYLKNNILRKHLLNTAANS